MRMSWLVPVLLFAVGCKSTDGGKTASTADPKTKPKHWLDGPSPDWAKGDVPKAGTWADPRDAKFDYTNYVKGALAGYVLDLGEKPAPNAVISVELADPGSQAGVQPMVVLADATGAFVVHGLKQNETYALTAKVKSDGTVYVGQTFATPPSVHVRIRLKDQMSLPAGTDPKGTSPVVSGDLPPLPGTDRPAPAPLARDGVVTPREMRSPNDRGWSPIPNGTAPTAPLAPGNDSVLPPPSATAPGVAPSRPELNTALPAPDWRPPAANVPGPGPAAIPPTIAPPPLPSESKSISRKATVSLLDAAGRTVEFPSGRPGELTLLDFMTTSCLPCKKAIPELVEFQRRYGANGLEIVGIVCDDAAESERRAATTAYARQNGLNYMLYTEAKAKAVRKQFNVDRFPTLVLLDADGTTLWTGHPKDMAELEKVVRTAMQRQ
jgi:thiol-disulfide isomerase/thioredoxin